MKWNELSMADRARYIRMGVASGLTNLNDIHSVYDSYIGTNTSSTRVNSYKDGGVKDKPWNKPVSEYNTYSALVMTDELYKSGREEKLEKPNYDYMQSDEWADAHGYYLDERGHRDDRVKKPTHPTHPSKGTFVGEEFRLSDKGMEDPNFTIFGLIDNKDGYAIPTYNGTIVLPELTVTPKRSYVHNSYDNINIVLDDRNRRYKDIGILNSVKNFFNYRKDKYSSHHKVNKFDGTSTSTQQMYRTLPISEIPEEYRLKTITSPSGEIKEWEDVNPNYRIYVDERNAPLTYNPAVKNKISEKVLDFDIVGLPMYAGPDLAQLALQNEINKRQVDRFIDNEYTAGKFLGEMLKPLNFTSPSQQFGAIVDWTQGEKGYWEGLMQGNSGFFSDKFAQEHPYLTLIGNVGIDFGLGIGGIDGIDMITNNSNTFIKNLNKGITKAGKFISVKNPWSKKYSNDRINNVLFEHLEPDYLKHFKDRYSTQYSKDEAGNFAYSALAKNQIKHDRMLSTLGEGDFSFVPDDNVYMNDDALDRYYRIMPLNKKYSKLKPIILTREEGLIRETFPEYYIYARQKGLPIDDETTFAKFLDRMSTSTRGVTLKDPKSAEEYLTIAGNTKGKPGGDRLFTNSGLYTSNSEEIADRFSKNISGITNNPYGAKAKLYHQFDIDYTLPISKRLQQLRDQINDVTVSIPADLKSVWIGDYKNRFNLSTPDYNSNLEIHAVEGPYMGEASKERVYIGHSTRDKVADVRGDIDISANVADRHHRWKAGKVSEEEGLFIPSYASMTPHNLQKYTQRIIESNPKWDDTFKTNLQKRLVRVMNIYRRRNRSRVIPVISAILGGTGIFTRSLYSDTKKSIEESNERFYNLLEAYHNTNYNRGSLEVLKHNLGMEDASDEEVIQTAEELYKELVVKRNDK